ncbi:MAG: hypothetical protein L3J06_01505 [Cyclobacteriaceae bacterium]|nr:hypothetical protein [Cyclobacteriaceae bacterium]
MKKIISVSLLVCLFLYSCKDKNEQEIKTNYFTYQNTTYDIESVLVDDYEFGLDNGFGHNLILYSPTISLVENPNTPGFLMPSGKGDYVYISCHSDFTKNLKTGEYKKKESGSFAISGGEVLIGINFEDNSEEVYELFNDANPMVISIEGNIYTISFEFTTESGEQVVGNYVGTITQQ